MFFKFKCIILFLCCFISFSTLYAQGDDFKFNHITTDNGLSSNNIFSIAQDSMGFIWIGTNNGLNRYNGYEIQNYFFEENDSNTIPNDNINCLYSDMKGRLWVGTNMGLALFDYQYHRFKRYYFAPKEFIEKNIVVGLTDHPGKPLLVATKGGDIYKYAQKEDRFVSLDINSSKRREVGSILYDDYGNLLVGYMDKVGIYTPNDSVLVNVRSQESEFNIVTSLATAFNKIWLASYPEGYKYITKEKGEYRVYTYEPLKGIIGLNIRSTDVKNLWMPSASGLYLVSDDEIIKKYSEINIDDHSLSYSSTTGILKDRDDNYWVGTTGGGVNVVYKNKGFRSINESFDNATPLFSTDVKSLYQDTIMNYWVGYSSSLELLSENFERKAVYFTEGNHGNGLGSSDNYCIFEYKGTLYVGNQQKGLQSYNYNKNRFKQVVFPTRLAFVNNDVRDYAIDGQNQLWLALHGQGLLKTDLESYYEIYTASNSGLISNWIYEITCDAGNNLWACSGIGLSLKKTNKQFFQNFINIPGDSTSLPSNFVKTVFVDSKQRIWIGTAKGLCRYSPEHDNFLRLSVNIGPRLRDITAIQQGMDNDLWLASSYGLAKLNLNYYPDSMDNLEAAVSYYYKEDGLHSNNFNTAYFSKHDSLLLFGGMGGITYFNPRLVKSNTTVPEVYISQMEIYHNPVLPNDPTGILEKHISFTEKIVLSHNQNHVRFTFSAINYIQSDKNKYAYHLEGFDLENTNWAYIGHKRSVVYSNLPPGTYTLRYKGANNDGLWNNNSKTLEIKVLPPWYNSWWFKILFVLICIGLLFVFIRFKATRIKTEKQHELDKLKIKFFTNISHEFRTPLTLILGPISTMLKETMYPGQKSKLTMVHRNALRLLRLVNQLLDMRKLENESMKLLTSYSDLVEFSRNSYESFRYLAKRQEIKYTFYTSYDSFKCYFDRDILDKVFYNLLSNAFKYTPSNHSIRVKLTIEQLNKLPKNIQAGLLKRNKDNSININKIAVLTVSDSGVGIEQSLLDKIFDRFYRIETNDLQKQSGTGIGLSLTKELVHLHNGVIMAESRKGRGSDFLVFFPVHLSSGNTESETTVSTSEDLEKYPHITNENYQEELEDVEDSNKNLNESVLIVDDNPDIRQYIKQNLNDLFNLLEASDGVEGYKIAQEEIPDLIVSDIMMPNVNGIDMVNKLKNDKSTSHIPVILLTAKGSDENMLEGLATGASDYITKPFSIDELKLKINNLIKNRLQLQEYYSNRFFKSDIKPKSSRTDDDFVFKLSEQISKNMHNRGFGPTQLAAEMAMSRTRFYKKVKALTNKPVNELIKITRLNEAARLLSSQNIPVNEVADRVGFKNHAHFTRTFSQQFGVSPSAFQKKGIDQ